MIIIGELINTSRKQIKEAVDKKDAEFIKAVAKKQADAGCDFIDVNCGTNIHTEPEDLKWVADSVQSAVNLPLCIDSPNPRAIEAALSVHKGRAFINSVTAEKERAEAILPLVKKHNCMVVGLAVSGEGVPVTAEERVKAAEEILRAVTKFGIDRGNLYIDAVVQPVATNSSQGMEFLKAIHMIKTSLGLKTVAGVSNVSFGLPKRTIINVSFLAMSIAFGLDAAIIDITDAQVYAAVKSANALTGNDQFCQEYISAFRKGRLR